MGGKVKMGREEAESSQNKGFFAEGWRGGVPIFENMTVEGMEIAIVK